MYYGHLYAARSLRWSLGWLVNFPSVVLDLMGARYSPFNGEVFYTKPQSRCVLDHMGKLWLDPASSTVKVFVHQTTESNLWLSTKYLLGNRAT